MAEGSAEAGTYTQSRNPWIVLNKLSIAEWLRAHGKFVRPELTKKQRLELKECFELIDADGSGAISSSEMLTAFHVLGIRARRSEVEKMLAEVDADGSGEVEYPEFVQIMTTKMDSVEQEAQESSSSSTSRASGRAAGAAGASGGGSSSKAQPLPFPLLAQAYRRKKLMEAVMQGDKATQERLQARAEEMEQERILAIAENEAQKLQVRKKPRVLSQLTRERMKHIGALNEKKQRREADLGAVPGHVLENLEDEDARHILLAVHERASMRRHTMAQHHGRSGLEGMTKEKSHPSPSYSNYPKFSRPRKPKEETQKDVGGPIFHAPGNYMDFLSGHMDLRHTHDSRNLREVRSKLQDQPTLEIQKIKLKAFRLIDNAQKYKHTVEEEKLNSNGDAENIDVFF